MWFTLAIISTLISPLIVVINKRALKYVDPIILLWGTVLIATPPISYFVLREGFPQLNPLFYLGLIGSVCCWVLSKVIQYTVIKKSNVTEFYPLIAVGPIFTLIISILPPLSERPSPYSVIGIVIIFIGLYILNSKVNLLESLKTNLLQPFVSIFKSKLAMMMLLSVFIDSLIIIFDKIAINNTVPSNPTFVLLLENMFVIIGLIPYLLLKKKGFITSVASNIKYILPLGLISAIVWLLGMSAVSMGDTAVVSAIFRTQLLLVIIYSVVFNKEKVSLSTVIGSVIMVLGVIVIRLVG